MQLRIFIKISEYNYERDEYCKNKTNISLPSQYSVSFTGIYSEVLYILVYIKLHIGKDIDKDQYACDIIYYNIGTWCNCFDDTITQYPGYTMNIYDELLADNKERQSWKIISMDVSDRIVSILYIK